MFKDLSLMSLILYPLTLSPNLAARTDHLLFLYPVSLRLDVSCLNSHLSPTLASLLSIPPESFFLSF